MVEELIEFQTAILAKEKGFDIEVLNQFNKDGESNTYENYDFIEYDWNDDKVLLPNIKGYPFYSRPSQSLLKKWLREQHHFHIEIVYKNAELMFGYKLIRLNVEYEAIDNLSKTYSCVPWSYEEALEEALKVVLKRI